MKGGKLPRGYTIVEVLIVLAVSGAMFAIAANFINGKQEKTAFQQGSNEFAAQLQSTIEQVTDGHYTDVPYNCNAGGAGQVTFSAGSATPSDCVVLGKILHFDEAGDKKKYEVFSLDGARLTNGKPVTLLPPPNPNPFQDTRLSLVDAPGLGFSVTKHVTLPQDMTVETVDVTPTSGPIDHNAYNIGFIEGLGTGDAVNGGYQSGAQSVTMVYDTSNPWQNRSEAYILMHMQPSLPMKLRTAASATICVSDGVRAADITIGGSGSSQLQVAVKQLGEVVCP